MANYNPGDVFVEKEFDNIFVLNPNKVYDEEGNAVDRNINQEDLVYYANLECVMEPRTYLINGANGTTELYSIATTNVNFLKPKGQNYFTTNWTNLTFETNDSEKINNELLGITSIDYRIGLAATPTVQVVLEDIRGRALFESGNDSIYSVFFNMPPPIFYLTIKGYYGKALRFPLWLNSFKASMDQQSGNFQIVLNFTGYKFTILTDVTVADLYAVPYMYPKTNTQNTGAQNTNATNGNGGFQNTSQNRTFLGMEYIKKVFDNYKELKIIDKNFPVITVPQLINITENFVTDTLKEFGQENADVLTNIDNYEDVVIQYKKSIYADTKQSWFARNTDQKNFWLTPYQENGKTKYKKLYVRKNVKTPEDQYSELDQTIRTFNIRLVSNPVFGDGGAYSLNKIPTINSATIGREDTTESLIDVVATIKEREGIDNPNESQIQLYKKDLSLTIEIYEKECSERAKNNKTIFPLFYYYNGPSSIKEILNSVEKSFNKSKAEIENDLTEKIAQKLESPKALGFRPTARNIAAIIFASTEAFLRLMSDVHKKAFNQRDNEEKRESVLSDVDTDVSNSPVYPWPEYVVENYNEKGDVVSVIAYPGDPKYVDQTNGDNYTIWPEIEFVEEYIRGFQQRNIPPVNPLQSQTGLEKYLIAGFDTPPNNLPYTDLNEITFSYELFERVYSFSQYQGFIRDEYDEFFDLFTEAETSNMLRELVKSPFLIQLFQENTFTTTQDYFNFLYDISRQGLSPEFQQLIRGEISNKVLYDSIDKSVEFFDFDIEAPVVSVGNETAIVNYFEKKKSHAKTYFTDLYPFVYKNWIVGNMPDGQDINNPIDINDTRQSLFFNQVTKKISNYKTEKCVGSNGDTRFNRPFTDFRILNNKLNNPVNIPELYTVTRQDSVNPELLLTEGLLDYLDYNGSLTSKQSTSMLNTPYFINALQLGIENQRNGQNFPYTAATYLFLQSLPLANLRERFKSKSLVGDGTELSVIASTLKKFGGVHAMPRLWVCKLGAIWHRYKSHIESNFTTDILDDVWGDFDAEYNFDPINFDATRNYDLIIPNYNDNQSTNQYSIVLENTVIPQNGVETDVINLGFYPNIMNDMNYFLNGTDLFTDFNNIDAELQSKISNRQVYLYNPTNSNILQPLYDGTKTLVLRTWSILIKDTFSDEYFTIPSFGTGENQIKYECFNNANILTNQVMGNPSIYNGSVRTLWGATNFGYFNTDNVVPPDYNQYFKKTDNTKKNQPPFELRNDNLYDYIEDIFAIFTKKELDAFEEEFKKFSDNGYNVKNDFTFQSMMKGLLKSNFQVTGQTDNVIVEDIQNKQNSTLSTYLSSEVNYNWVMKMANPTHFDLQGLNYFTSGTTQQNIYISVFPTIESYNTTTPNALPNAANSVTLNDVITNYPEEYKSLLLNVGFSSISSITYSNTTSYVFDFFIDNDIAFNLQNIEYFSNVIKIFATQKLREEINPTQTWQVLVNDYFRDISIFSNLYFRQVFSALRTSLKSNKKKTSTELIGDVTKLEYYRRFKALNDKWIAQLDYNRETLFTDVTFNDRGNRDIGSKVLLDMDIVKKFLKSNWKSSVEAAFRNIVISNNFVVLSLPSYINFYGVPTPTANDENNGDEGPILSNGLFGIFKEVDYQESRSKVVCLYNPPSSEHVGKTANTEKNLFGYNDDGIYLTRDVDNPLHETSNKKTDWAQSNKVIGYAVDFGLQNQQVFKTIDVSQENGKNTSEAIAAEVRLRNVNSGVESSPQTQSLFNIYLLRSYQSNITMLGNAMIQPTQYFVLRNVPLFAGSYWIQNVNHTINQDGFTTTVQGIRQKVAELPTDSLYLQSIKKSYLSKIIKDNKQSRQNGAGERSDIIKIKGEVSSFKNQKEPALTNTCTPNVKYSTYISITPVATDASFNEIKESLINATLPSDARRTIFVIFYLESNIDPNVSINTMTSFNYNFAGIPLSRQWGGSAQFFEEEFVCINQGSPAITESYAVFQNIGACINFCNAKYMESFRNRISDFENRDLFIELFTKAYIEIFPYNKLNEAPNVYDDYIQTNLSDYEKLKQTVASAYDIAVAINL